MNRAGLDDILFLIKVIIKRYTEMIEQIKQLIADELHIDSASIADDADIIEDLGADSLSVVTIIMNAEDEFGLSIPDELVADLRTPAAMAEYLKNNKK